MRITRAATAGLVALALAAVPASAQSVRFLKYTPAVLPANASGSLLIEVEISGTASRVNVDFAPAGTATTPIELRDNGAGGDRQAGDNTFTAQLPAAPILAALRVDDVHRVAIGFLNVFNPAGASVLRGNLFADVYASDAGTYPITRLSQFVQTTTKLVNIQDAAFFVSGDISHVTQEFYRWFGDDYDILNLIYEPQRFANRTHSAVKNAVSGIGLVLTDNSSRFGSAGRLQGYSEFPIPGFFDGAATGHIHELGHQWINFLNVSPFASGVPHWPKSSMASGIMGFSIGGTGGEGGEFPCTILDQNGTVVLNPRPDAPTYNDLDLYLMGLLPADQVRQQIVFADQAGVAQLTCTGQTFTGQVIRVSAQDVVAQFGPRNPPFPSAPTTIRMATILVTRDDIATQEQMWLYSWFADRGELRTRVATHEGFSKTLGQPFYVATGGRATLDMHLEPSQGEIPDFTLQPSPASRTVTAGSSASFTMSVTPTKSAFDGDVTFACGSLPAHAACVFSPTHVVPGTTAGQIGVTISTKDAGTSARVWDRTVPLSLALCLCLAWPRRRVGAGDRGRGRRPLWAAVLMVALQVACGSNGGSGSTTPPPGSGGASTTTTAPGTYAITMTGSSGSLQRTTTVSLTVQ
jgi:hypothetical protein